MIETRTIYFIYQRGCAACEEAEPLLLDFQYKHIGEIFVIRTNAQYNRRVLGWSPPATPSYLLVLNRVPVAKHTGVLTLAELEKFAMQKFSADDEEDTAPKKTKKGKEEEPEKDDAEEDGEEEEDDDG